MKSEKGQQMVEYIILFVVIVLVALAFLAANGRMKSAVEGSLELNVKRIDANAKEFKNFK